MDYFFLDESYPPVREQKKIVTAAWAVEQHKWNENSVKQADLFKSPIVERIGLMLESLGGRAVVATAALDESFFRAGEIDRTDDITAMARSDNVWSMSAIFAIAHLVRELLRDKRDVGTIDIHLDPKNLKSAHSDAVKKTLRELLVGEARRFASQLNFRNLDDLRIRRVEFVTKTSVGEARDKFQMGTWVADRLCAYSDQITSLARFPRIRVIDMTDTIKRTVQQFDGKSFYE